MNKNKFAIFQLLDGNETRDYRFKPYDFLKASGRSVEWKNYKHIYTGTLDEEEKRNRDNLDKIFLWFNDNRPEDFRGHSLSVSDVVVLYREGKTAAYYVDSFSFTNAQEFVTGPYKYYSTQRPVDIATYPRTDSGPVYFVNFDKREWIENATGRAWGFLAYDAPLTLKQMDDYELRAASSNPDNLKVSQYQLEAQLEVIGKWEQARGLSDRARITWYHSDMGTFVKKEWVMNDYVADRFRDIVEVNKRAAEKRAERKQFTNYGLKDSPASHDEKKRMMEQVQLVGIWENEINMPENERFAWHKPSIHAYALKEPPVSPDLLEQRYDQAKLELSHADKNMSAPKPIMEQLAEAGKLAERGTEIPAKKPNMSHEDR